MVEKYYLLILWLIIFNFSVWLLTLTPSATNKIRMLGCIPARRKFPMVPVTRLVERKRDQIEAVIRAEERRCWCGGKSGGIEVTAIAQPMWKADANKTAAWMLLTTGPACQQKPRGFSLLHAHYLSILAYIEERESISHRRCATPQVNNVLQNTEMPHAAFSLSTVSCRRWDNKRSEFSLNSALQLA